MNISPFKSVAELEAWARKERMVAEADLSGEVERVIGDLVTMAWRAAPKDPMRALWLLNASMDIAAAAKARNALT